MTPTTHIDFLAACTESHSGATKAHHGHNGQGGSCMKQTVGLLQRASKEGQKDEATAQGPIHCAMLLLAPLVHYGMSMLQ